MVFKIIGKYSKPPLNVKSTAYLVRDDWNDYAFYTLFKLQYVDESLGLHHIGSVKIGYIGQEEGGDARRLSIGHSFDALDDSHFSLGQSDTYYVNLNSLGSEIRDDVLKGLNDIAKDSNLFNRVFDERVTRISLFRSVSPTSVTGQFRRLSNGGARLTDYNFKFIAPKIKQGASSFSLSFSVKPESVPPTNIHVLIGRNGVGKTHLINNMIDALIEEDRSTKKFGEFKWTLADIESHMFANLISVSFSAFDKTEPKPEKKDKGEGIQYSYIGLKQVRTDGDEQPGPKSNAMLYDELVESLDYCKRSSKKDRWKKCIEMLESDPNFKEAEIKSLIDIEGVADFKKGVAKIFERLSSGHKVVLLTITRLIEKLQEKSLVILDEPEAHLHPPLLSAFIRTLSELLIDCNAVAIIATHSPVILQEVPRSCAWKLRRTGAEAINERLSLETFGENVGTLTNEVFGLEVTESGFYKIIDRVAKDHESYNEALNYFNGQLGMEARAILMSYFANSINN
ncbi:ATP-binding protein [Pontibacter sp. KCTC 32443]|uniref:AAA family ATPase n=1 Tax=Pontibacter TaxID=323449 RepID=UPI00164EBC50|nr:MULTISPECIES: AAA family ATPase [Pontibacter]MBC5774329.1 ATP-binding protein [Pontibacter sp. KCTC 32443]